MISTLKPLTPVTSHVNRKEVVTGFLFMCLTGAGTAELLEPAGCLHGSAWQGGVQVHLCTQRRLHTSPPALSSSKEAEESEMCC